MAPIAKDAKHLLTSSDKDSILPCFNRCTLTANDHTALKMSFLIDIQIIEISSSAKAGDLRANAEGSATVLTDCARSRATQDRYMRLR